MTKRKTTKPSSKKAKRTQAPRRRTPAIEPSHTRGHITARRMGRPARLSQEVIAQFIEHLRLGLPLGHAAALSAMRTSQMCDWLRDGRRDVEAGRATIAAEFSEQVRTTLAEVQKTQLGSLVVYQRMAEGWMPTCARCKAKGGPCGRHRKNLRLAADLAWKMLTHRFPSDWNASTVRHEIGSGDDAEDQAVTTSGEADARPAMVAGLVVFMPRRNDGI